MKRIFIISGLIFAVFGAIFSIGFSTSAVNTSVIERFNIPNKKDVGMTGSYTFDKAHSAIGFRVMHMGLADVPGYFKDFKGTVNYDAKDVTKSSVEFTAMMTSVDTRIEGRDKHLRSADFFDVEKFPEMTFKSTKVEKKGKKLMVTGDLTMRGVTKSITFPFTVAGFLTDQRSGGMKMGVFAETTINRRDFGVNYGTNLPNGTPMLSDNVVVVLNIEANMPAPATTK
ncbi:MAG TPA: YceI family protein [Pyrinomonadaceae bacterium]|nr:YceI family protein [Pyrinomonadaceae bacterium]